jgi:hypothetical protein
MRRLLSGLVSATLIISQAEAASSHFVCARPVEKAAFDIAGLKSQLMVTALSCSMQDRYNAFVVRYRASLMAEDRALNTYFGRAYGRGWQSRHDDYVTLLANSQSEQGTRLGSDFCRQKVSMFDQVMALQDIKELPQFAAGQSFQQPIDVVACPPVIRTARHVVHHRASKASGQKAPA